MSEDEFREAVRQARDKNPAWFDCDSDPPATAVEIERVQKVLGVVLPQDYVVFLKEYGGGDFAFASIFSARPGSGFDVVENNKGWGLDKNGFLAVAEDGLGNSYGYRVVGGQAQPGLVLAVHGETLAFAPTPYANLFEYLAERALRSVRASPR